MRRHRGLRRGERTVSKTRGVSAFRDGRGQIDEACQSVQSLLPLKRPCPVLGFFPGNSIGNMEPVKGIELLSRMRPALEPGWLVIGLDHNGDRNNLKVAYGGPLMASFYKNILVRMMRDLEARIAVEDFEHQVRVQSTPTRVEAHLVARTNRVIEVNSRKSRFAPGDSIRTGTSWKHTPSEFAALIAAAGWNPIRSWSSRDAGYALHLLHAAGEAPQ